MADASLTVVTGASSGLGVAFARLAAADGRRLMLVARREERMRALAAELESVHGVAVEVYPCDLADPAQRQALCAVLADRDVGLLINNAGVGLRGRLDQQPEDRIDGMVEVNMAALTELSRAVAPGMAERRRGGILQVGSLAAFLPGPRMAVYFASKAYVQSFSEALWAELRPFGVSVTVLCPGPTESEFHERAVADGRTYVHGNRRLADATAVARAGYRGVLRGQRRVVPGAVNAAFAVLSPWVPRRLLIALGHRINARKP